MLDLAARRFRTLGEPYRLRILQAGGCRSSVLTFTFQPGADHAE